ncbi:MAG: putative ABC transporter permease [Peptococcaceae bacterium]
MVLSVSIQTNNMLKRFLFYGTLGWITEVMWTGLGSLLQGKWTLDSHTYLWMFPIYGLAVFLEPVHEEIRSGRWWVRGLVYMVLIFAIEFSTGYLLTAFIGQCPWDYSGSFFSWRGFIRLDYAPVWFTAGLLFEQIHDQFVRRYLGGW